MGGVGKTQVKQASTTPKRIMHVQSTDWLSYPGVLACELANRLALKEVKSGGRE